jgi:hypothetical protein
MAFAIDSLYQLLAFLLLVLGLSFISPSIERFFGRIGENWAIAISIMFIFGL